jgi:hypothetical protein
VGRAYVPTFVMKGIKMSAKSRIWVILCGLVVALVVWSLPSLAQDTSDMPVFVLTVGSQSCTLAPAEVEVAEATVAVSAAPRATYRPTLTPLPPTPSGDAAAEGEAEAEVESFSTGDLMVLTLGDDCAELLEQLQVPANGVLWISITLEDDPDTSLPLGSLEDDSFPPQLDQRGRYFGCTIQEQGEQVCHVVVTLGEVSYQIDVPVVVEGAFIAPTTVAPTSPPPEEPTAIYFPEPSTTEQP